MSARTSGLSSIQGDLGESGKGIFTSQSNTTARLELENDQHFRLMLNEVQ